ncbi:MAG: response regulator, partial [Thiomargarita sp.]|nr:response regulator [Thiomargarita sp.]
MSIGTVTILIVDDNKNNLLSLRSLIEEDFEHVNVVESLSGLNALSILMKQEVDLIILDIQMPQMDGFETAKIIQSRTKTQHVPIVFLTAAYKSADFKKKGYELGAVDYLTKPIDPDKLVSKLHTYLRFVKQRHQPAPVATP